MKRQVLILCLMLSISLIGSAAPLYKLTLKEPVALDDGNCLTWTSMLVETAEDRDGNYDGSMILLELSLSQGTESEQWSLTLPTDYHTYLREHPQESTHTFRGKTLRIIDEDLDSSLNPWLQIEVVDR